MFNTFHATSLFRTPKTSEDQRFFDVFEEDRKRPVGRNTT